MVLVASANQDPGRVGDTKQRLQLNNFRVSQQGAPSRDSWGMKIRRHLSATRVMTGRPQVAATKSRFRRCRVRGIVVSFRRWSGPSNLDTDHRPPITDH
jgi:hypothetical protein